MTDQDPTIPATDAVQTSERDYFPQPVDRPFKPLLGPLSPTSHRSMAEVIERICSDNSSTDQ